MLPVRLSTFPALSIQFSLVFLPWGAGREDLSPSNGGTKVLRGLGFKASFITCPRWFLVAVNEMLSLRGEIDEVGKIQACCPFIFYIY